MDDVARRCVFYDCGNECLLIYLCSRDGVSDVW